MFGSFSIKAASNLTSKPGPRGFAGNPAIVSGTPGIALFEQVTSLVAITMSFRAMGNIGSSLMLG